MSEAVLKPGTMVLPFGTTSWTAERMRLEPQPDGGWLHDCPVAHAVAGQGGHRLSSATHNLPAPAHLEAGDHAGMVAFLKNRAGGLCDIWNKRQAAFIDLYFTFIAAHLEEHGAEVNAMAAEYSGLYRPDHWLFSAFAPLPQAHIYAGAAGAVGADRFVPAPAALWTDTAGIAVYFPGSETVGGKTASDQARLRGAGIEILELAEGDLASADSLGAALPDAVRYYWRGEDIPMGPFAPELADEIG